MNWKIVQAKPADIDAIFQLIRSERQYLLYRNKKELRLHLKHFVVVRNAEVIIGCASYENYSPEIAEIRSLVVLPEYRGQRIGKQLIRTLLKRKLKRQKVFVVTSKIAYFEHLGFHNALKEKYVLFKR